MAVALKDIVTTQGADKMWTATSPLAPGRLGFGAYKESAIASFQMADILRNKALREGGLASSDAVIIWKDVAKALENAGWTITDYPNPPNGGKLRVFSKDDAELSIHWEDYWRVSDTALAKVIEITGLDGGTIVATGDPQTK